MDKLKVGLLTIGQSPREDIMTEIRGLFLPHIEIVERGLLDELNPEAITKLKPEITEPLLVSRLTDGSQVQLSEKKICELLPQAIDLMKTKLNVQAVGILCTHDFPKTIFPCPVLFPSAYLDFLINSLLKVRRLGVVVPLSKQIELVKTKWKKERTAIEAKSPYKSKREKTWEEIAQRFAREKVEAVILDCIGYRMIDREKIQRLLAVPILLPRTILAFAINQLF